jgi:asparagine synthase (glutamine-hydrolysing)
MCGINGIAYSPASGRSIDADILVRMRDVLHHRGPDESGIFIDGNVGFGHRRLSIVDLANGQQPMASDRGRCVITYNGEVYNHAEHREYLARRGHRFRTHCDTETILHLYEEFGDAAVHKLRGMFAFAIWDADKRALFLARDRLGVKPLYYVHSDDGSLFFASEIKALFAAGIKREINYRALPDQLANHGTSGDETLFRGVKRLPPGCTMRWTDGRLSIERFWDLAFEPKLNGAPRSDADWVAEWSALFRRSVELRLMADVPLGMFLSGGIDSSAIAAVMSELAGEVKTFSVAFAEREANELEYARAVSAAFKTDHYEVIVSPEEFFAALPRLVWHEDEPLAHPSSVALNFVSELAARHVKVVLTGEGSDESLAGYGRYATTLLNLRLGKGWEGMVPPSARSAIAAAVGKLPKNTRFGRRLGKSFLGVEPSIESMYFDNFAVFPRRMQEQMFTRQTREQIGDAVDPYAEMKRLFDRPDIESLLDRMLYTDTRTYLHELLMKQDQMSMAASIESRVPFLDHQLMEFAARMPDHLKLRGRTTKYVLREAMKGILPPQILSRPKMGFPVPVGKWLRTSHRHLIEEYILGERALARGIFDRTFIRRIVAGHMRGEDHSERLWALLNFEMWQRRFIDGEGA